jgi:cyclic pyranopterin monophosphate synthase
MVDVGAKPATARRARAGAFVRMNREALDALSEDRLAKGDALAAARLAGIQAAKRTSDWIPLCHPLPITHARVELSIEPEHGGVRIETEVATIAPTGVEMEALTAAAGAALTLYDMVKALDRSVTIEDLALLEKEGGRSGRYVRGKAR